MARPASNRYAWPTSHDELDTTGRTVLAGVSIHACITQTARDAFANNVRTTVVTDAVADHDEAHQEPALSLLAADRQAQLATVAEVLAAWDSPHAVRTTRQ